MARDSSKTRRRLIAAADELFYDRFAVAGYAETKPIDTNESVEGRTHNRRVDIVILNQAVIVNQGNIGSAPKKTAH